MLCLAEAIEERASVSFKRCGLSFVDIRGEKGAILFSPRNSFGKVSVVSLQDVDDLANEIREKLQA
jgi:hypothetical protein